MDNATSPVPLPRTIPFVKMQGTGNDFVVLDETQGLFDLCTQDYVRLADRHFGVGADQILSVRKASVANADFDYVIHNADGAQVEHCGNGARCLMRFVREQGLTTKKRVTVKTLNRILSLVEQEDGRVSVDMGEPQLQQLSLALTNGLQGTTVSVGNPHVVLVVEDVLATAVQELGPKIQALPLFPQGVNVGFMQVRSPTRIDLRVYERGAGETLACGTGACAAVVAGVALGVLQPRVDVHARGGVLTIEYDASAPHATLRLTAEAQTVFTGTVVL